MGFGAVVLIRGINVGGKNRVAMSDLRAAITDVGGGDCATYIQSGNAVCEHQIDPNSLSSELERRVGFRPAVIAIPAESFVESVRSCPFDLTAGDGKSTHVYFSQDPVEFDLGAALQLASPTEQIEAGVQTVYLWAPDGIARSKLAAKVERFSAAPLTARNGRTALRLLAMLTDGISEV